MSEHLSPQQMDRLLRRELTPSQLVDATRHLVDCEACRLPLQTAVADTSRPAALLRLFKPSAESYHLEYEQMAGYVDHSLDSIDRDITENHLAACEACAAEVRELGLLRANPLSYPNTPRMEHLRPSLWRRIIGQLSLPDGWLSAPAVAMALALIVILASSWAVYRSVHKTAGTGDQSVRQTLPDSAPSATSTPDANKGSNIKETNPTPVEGPVIVALNDGRAQVTLDEQGRLTGLPDLAAGDQQTIKQMLTNSAIVRPATINGLVGKTSVLLGENSEASQGVPFSLLSPIGTVVKSSRPVFRWRPLSGATSYTVVVLDSRFNEVAASEPLTGTSWTPPRALGRNKMYLWQVTALKDGKRINSPAAPAPEARFRVLADAPAEELKLAAQNLRGSHLALGALYLKTGLLDDAETEFGALVKANPKSPVARKLLRQVIAIRRDVTGKV